uniref:TFIIS N-terminal domain-containing protein n=1 Tax=Ditylenchus dipsaci TaxID=166011 RepID=A0A915E0L3_9BILA
MIKEGEKVGHALKRLDQVDITLELLSQTGVGKVINRLKNDEEFGGKALAIVEKWKQIAKDEQKFNPVKESPTTSASKPSKKSKRTAVDDDPFLAELEAMDKINSAKPKKPKFSAKVVDDLERSLVSNPSNGQSSSFSSFTQSTEAEDSFQKSIMESGMFKPRKGMNKMYAGKKKAATYTGPVPRLFDICMKVCMQNIDAIEETGDIPFDILKPVLEKCSNSQLAKIESKNPYLEEDTDYLWERHCQKTFPNFEVNSDDDEEETWRERFLRFTYERDQRLKSVAERIGKQKEALQPVRKAMMADPIAPKDARRRQIKNGIVCSSAVVPTAQTLSKSRRQIFETGSRSELSQMPKAVRHTTSTLGSTSAKKPVKKGALMMKTIKMLKGKR